MKLNIVMRLTESEAYPYTKLAFAELELLGAFFDRQTIESLAEIVAQQLWQQMMKATSEEVMPPPEYQPDIEDKLPTNLPGEEVNF